MNIKVRIILKAKKDFGTTKVGDTLILYNNVFDAMTGIAFYPIDRSQWILIAYTLFTGLIDKNGKEIYEGDILENPNYKPDDWERCEVKWHEELARFGLNFYSPYGGEGYTGREQHLDRFVSEAGCYVIGNIYENDIYDKNLADKFISKI